ncbi:PRC-barrel domain containing protein [Pseudoroseomonas wenyumeiae]|uniref:PRC-barrel domain containing protein n=1 Tax=Teichococcus wenyumeiae TaxID=2478470 RepID=A0A3A9JZ32_9PROT|nr:PRC-barrel domain-containing protein [Pseudoroseomonas wenyumeiae]RKK04359.1 PRC-barrel domain containing protein [Pseudoroseomonas wenyumeiae]RMI24500.1 PRC-barrel domain containing protein [Pseudoroseomonas wenyumeiae]
MRQAICVALLSIGIAGGAMAQGTTPGAGTPGTAPGSTTTTITTTTPGGKFATVKPTDVMAEEYDDIQLINKQGQTIGEIEDLVIDNGKTVTGIVVSVGGFLGMGERHVVLNPSAVTIQRDGSNLKGTVDMTQDELKNAPAYSYKSSSK